MSTGLDVREGEGLPDLGSGSDAPSDRVLVCDGYDHTVRWRAGDRLQHLFEDRCDRMRDDGRGHHLAVDAGDTVLTYDQLDARANQLARHLIARGARSGDRIGLLFDQAVHSYVGMLAVLKINAAYVPLDAGFPSDRVSYIVQDAGVHTVLTLSHLRDNLQHIPATTLCLDEVAALVAAEEHRRLADAEKGDPVDELCYIIYTSGSTGRPKGVPIEHASICNFVRVAVEVYGIQPRDRVYQGMTIAFDFSVEEIWVPLVAGATLVPKPGGCNLLGHDLHEFIEANGITAMCCVPTLLATLDEDLPDLRFLLVSGEACPQDLITRWHRPGRRFLNVYGPTEATVTATWTTVHPDRPVTIGVPLPTYSAVILDPAGERALHPGEVGEIGIAGIGLAAGYLNRDDLTDRAFIRDFLGIADNPSGRIYRTGDLGRVNDDGEIEYHGRIDTQVKIRGYRIELTEIESVLLRVPGIAQAVVDTYEPQPGTVELVAYYSRRHDTAGVDPEQVYEQLRDRLPRYMVPAYLEELAVIPMTTSDKADRKNLPAPSGRRGVVTQQDYIAPTTATEQVLAHALEQALRLDQVSVDSHFFDDLGADSLLMAQFCSRVRQRSDLLPVAMKDVYLHPTIRSLAADLAGKAPTSAEPRAAEEAVVPAGTARYAGCGVLQLLAFLASAYLGALVLEGGFEWVSGGAGPTGTYLRSLVFGVVSFLALCIAPVVAKWLLVGRWKPQQIPVWSLAYVRFWLVKVMIRANPLVLLVGSPLYVLYLKALGARIGRGVAIFSRTVPVCTDLLTIGDGTVIRKDSFFTCYRAVAGRIQTGTVTLGKDVYVGEKTVLDIETSLGDGAQLGHCSSLHAGQAVPAGQRWHGSPAQRAGMDHADVDYRAVAATRCGTLRRLSYSVLQLLSVLVLSAPLGFTGVVTLFKEVSWLSAVLDTGHDSLTSWTWYAGMLVVSFVTFFGAVLGGLVVVVTVPRVLNRALRPDTVYPLYGFHYAIQRTITRMTNAKFYTDLFGDSSYIVHYLRALGYDLSRVVQTGSNFGTELKQDSPYLSTVGSGTMVSDALSIMNADFSSTSFRMSRVSIGERNFLGNNIAFPVDTRTGENCLLATKVMVPMHGPVRENVGLLGSPCFEIPRSVQRDSEFDRLATGAELRHRLAAKNRYNITTWAIFLLVRWFQVCCIALIAGAAADLHYLLGAPVIAASLILIVAFSVAYTVLVERAVARFRPLRPQLCSIYDPYFWWHERLWKLLATPLFNGTPFKNVVWRLLGVKIGRRVFDDGCSIPEKTLVTIGDDCTLNAGSVIQCHSLEDGTFKSDRTTIGAGCTLGVETFVHYGVTMGDGCVLDADAFLMKGEETEERARWRGNPAREIRVGSPVRAARRHPASRSASAVAGSRSGGPAGHHSPDSSR
ncbi:MAG: Pls/PosA family non-ribosomal peptide synthetase [Pseudonocardiaceae bacterium]